MTKGIRKLFLGLFLVAIVSISCQVQAKADTTYDLGSGIEDYSVTVDGASGYQDGAEHVVKLTFGDEAVDIYKFQWDTGKWAIILDDCSTYGLSATGITEGGTQDLFTISTSDVSSQRNKLFTAAKNEGTVSIKADLGTADNYTYYVYKVNVGVDDGSDTGLTASLVNNTTGGYIKKNDDFEIQFNRTLGNGHEKLVDANGADIISRLESDKKTLKITADSDDKVSAVNGMKYNYDTLSENAVIFDYPFATENCPVGEVTEFSVSNIESAFGNRAQDTSTWDYSDITFTSSSPVLGLEPNGVGRYKIKPTSEGVFEIKAVVADGKKPGQSQTLVQKITVQNAATVLTGIDIVEASLSVGIGSENAKELTLKPVPETAELDYDKITAGTDNETIAKATVDKANKKITVEGIAAGTAKVTVKYNGERVFEDTCDITVTGGSTELTGLDIVEASINIGIGSSESKKLTIKPIPDAAVIDYSKITAESSDSTVAKATVDTTNKTVTVEGIKAGTATVTVKYDGSNTIKDTCTINVTSTPDPGTKVVVDFDSLKITIPTSTSVLSKVNGAQIIADIDGTNYYYSGSAWKTAATNVTFKSSGTSETITLGATTVTSMLKLLGKTLKAEKIDIDNVTITVIPYSSTDKKTDAAAEGSSDIDSYWIELDTSENAESYKVDDVETKDYFYGFPGLSYTIVASGKSGYTFKKWDGYEEKTNTLTYYPMEDATLTAIFTKGGTPGGDGEAVVSLNAADMYIKVPATAAGMTENVTGVVLLASTGAVNYEYNGSGWVKVASATPNPYYCLSVSGSLTTGYYEMASSSVRSMLKSLGWQLKNDGVDASVISLYAFPCNKESLAVDATKYATNFDTILMSKISLSYEKNAAAYIVDSSTMSSSSNAYFNAFYGLTYSVISQGSSSFRFSKWDGDTSHMSNTTSSSMTYSAPNAAQSVTAVYESSSSSSSSSSMRTSSSSSSSSMTRGGSGSGSGDYDEVPKTGESKTDIWILWGVLFASILGAGFMIYKRFGLVKAIARAEEDEAKEAMAAEQKAKEERINMITDLRNLK